MKKVSVLLALIFTVCISFAFAQGGEKELLADKHDEYGVSCEDCHGTPEPVKKAPVSSCKNCHGNNDEGEAITFKDAGGNEYTVNPHASHAGNLRCTLCHQSHEPSKLYCNEGCHHSFQLDVP